jgi:cytochrome c553
MRGAAAILVGGIAAAWPAMAADPPPGAAGCSGCHAPPGRVASPSIPPIDGMRAADMVEAMEDFRKGRRPATVMDRIARGFTPEETRAIAAWLEKLK